MNVDPTEVYSYFTTIQDELARRRRDPELMRKVEELFGEDMLIPISMQPLAMLSRSIATPNKELEYFLDLLKDTAFDPVVLEYNGKLVARNSEKYFLCKLHFCDDFSKQTLRKLPVIDFNASEGSMLHDLSTKSGENLKNMHRRLLAGMKGSNRIAIVDITSWFNRMRVDKKGYYFYFLSLFIVHGALFENYLFEDREERAFFETKILPSFKAVCEYFGVKPLIFPLLPTTIDHRDEWLYYKKHLEEVI